MSRPSRSLDGNWSARARRGRQFAVAALRICHQIRRSPLQFRYVIPQSEFRSSHSAFRNPHSELLLVRRLAVRRENLIDLCRRGANLGHAIREHALGRQIVFLPERRPRFLQGPLRGRDDVLGGLERFGWHFGACAVSRRPVAAASAVVTSATRRSA